MPLKISLYMVVASLCSWSAFAEVGTNDGDALYDAAIQKHRAEIASASDYAISNIIVELQKLAKTWPSFADISNVIIARPGMPESGNSVLQYFKNARYVVETTSGNRFAAASRESLVIEKGGVALTIAIQNTDYPGARKLSGKVYPLISKGGLALSAVNYSLQVNPANALVESTVKNIVETQVDILGKSLKRILDIDPEAETSDASGKSMTNILRKLEGLAQEFPTMRDISSATIEHDGPRYVYSHLRFWTNVHAELTTNTPRSHPELFDDNVVLGIGGVALDIYLVNEDQPFDFTSNIGYTVFSAIDGKRRIVLVYRFRDSDTGKSNIGAHAGKDAAESVKDIMDSEAQELRRTMDKIVYFPSVK